MASGCTEASPGECLTCTVCDHVVRECANTSDTVCGTGCAQADPAIDKYAWLEEGTWCRPGQYLRAFDTASDAKDCWPCPVGWAGLNGVYCERCGPLEEPYYIDQSSCVCKGSAVMNASGACVCPDGHRLAGGACEPCQANTYGMGGSCWACGAGNFTRGAGQTACEACEFGKYRLSGQASCSDCAQAGWYAPDAGSSACVQCDPSCAAPGLRWESACPGADGFSVCKECEPSLPGNATWRATTTDPTTQRAMEECAYDCKAGFFHVDGGCEQCTAVACDAGWRPAACTSFSDANCDTACEDATKPFIHSHWKIGIDCPWACDDGYELSVWDYGMFLLRECVLA
jgi:hypothetical protein